MNYQDLTNVRPAETSAQIKERVNKTRSVQLERFKGLEGVTCNASMSHKQVRKFCAFGKEESDLLKMAMTELNLSARAYDKVLKVARTIADMEGSEQIKTEHLAEAIQYRGPYPIDCTRLSWSFSCSLLINSSGVRSFNELCGLAVL